MIYITICSGEKGELASCSAKGHSGFAQEGKDIVCAAVSVLFRTTALALEEKCKNDEALKVDLSYHERGNIEIRVLGYGEESFTYLTFLFEFLSIGLSSLSGEYPESVSLEYLINNK
ncbi:MAG: ribosomal-processing cysteine protease Prp [Treponema sp.]